MFALLILSLLYSVERKKICLLKDSDETTCTCGEKVHETVDEWRTMLTVTSEIFLVRNKNQQSQ